MKVGHILLSITSGTTKMVKFQILINSNLIPALIVSENEAVSEVSLCLMQLMYIHICFFNNVETDNQSA